MNLEWVLSIKRGDKVEIRYFNGSSHISEVSDVIEMSDEDDKKWRNIYVKGFSSGFSAIIRGEVVEPRMLDDPTARIQEHPVLYPIVCE